MLICFILLLVGCKRMDQSDNYIELVNNCLNDHAITNDVSSGYKYYIPKGVKKIHDYDYNQVFLVDDSYIYLYVDIISYFNNKDVTIAKESDDYYYQSIQYKKNKGYLKIKEENDQYFVSIGYHYSKIEVYTPKKNINKIITLSTIILNSIEYNDVIIEKILEGDFGQFSEFSYEVDKPEDASNKFSQYLEEYVQKEKQTEQLPGE